MQVGWRAKDDVIYLNPGETISVDRFGQEQDLVVTRDKDTIRVIRSTFGDEVVLTITPDQITIKRAGKFHDLLIAREEGKKLFVDRPGRENDVLYSRDESGVTIDPAGQEHDVAIHGISITDFRHPLAITVEGEILEIPLNLKPASAKTP